MTKRSQNDGGVHDDERPIKFSSESHVVTRSHIDSSLLGTLTEQRLPP